MQILKDILWSTWIVTGQMAPSLLLGFLMAGVLSVFISPELVERHLGKRGFWQVCKAALLGVPLPLCSCGVVPVTASLRRHGAGKGATLSFLASTPQTGVDSILATHALLGPVLVIFRVVTAFVSGLLSGMLVEALDRDDTPPPDPKTDCPCCHAEPSRGRLQRMLHYGFVVLARDIGAAMLIGILVSGILAAVIPEGYFAGRIGSGFTAMLVMLVVGIPLYVCSTGSVPIAFAMIHMGISPGAALVFLVSGPATNAATITTLWGLLGKGATLVYLASIAVCAVGAGLLLDALATGPDLASINECLECHGFPWFNHLSAVVLLIVLLPSLRRLRWPRFPRTE